METPSRKQKMLIMATNSTLRELNIPKYESTKGTTHEEQNKALSSDILKVNQISLEVDEMETIGISTLETQNSTDQGENKEEAHEMKKESSNDKQTKENESMYKKKKKEVGNKYELREKRDTNTNDENAMVDNYEYISESEEEPFQDSGSEYVPSDSENYNLVFEEPIFTLKDNKSIKDQEMEQGVAQQENNSDKNEHEHETEQEHSATVESNFDTTIVAFGSFVASQKSDVEVLKGNRPWTKQSLCPYCFKEVTHFPRHLARNHKNEGAVIKLMSMESKDPERKRLLDCIRRQGNFTLSTQESRIRPIRRPKTEEKQEKYVACPNCLGYFSRKYLRRHAKRCVNNSISVAGQREKHLSKAQIFAICSGDNHEFYSSLRLKEEVFTIMREDEISKTAMKDILICTYADSQLRKHKKKQIKNVISNKMRELGRLLISLKSTTGVQTLFDSLKPEMFDSFVAAAKIISGYDPVTHTFKASSLALHLGTSLKQVCDIATKAIIKKSKFFPCQDREKVLKEIKRLKQLFENHWNLEVASLALKNLNENHNEKPKLLPLTSDIIKFQDFVLNLAKSAQEKIAENGMFRKEYRQLIECVLALALLLNRKRVGEIQYLKMQNYLDVTVQNQQEELFMALSDAEKVLSKSFKRVLTVGKGSKTVAILFSMQMQEFIDVLLKFRQTYVPKENEYLFANPNTLNSCISGYHTLKKLAESSGVQDTSLFTSTRLRKQIATVLQVININQDEMKQFATFMGHTTKTHEQYYRLPQGVYETAKVSKILMAINSGKGHLFKGKTLDEVEVNENDMLSDSDSEANDEQIADTVNTSENIQTTSPKIPQEESEELNYSSSEEQTEKKTGKIKRIRWTQEQKNVIKLFFKDHIKKKRAPKKHEVEELLKEHGPLFKGRNWVKIKAVVYNFYK